jgi:hypothetical protein
LLVLNAWVHLQPSTYSPISWTLSYFTCRQSSDRGTLLWYPSAPLRRENNLSVMSGEQWKERVNIVNIGEWWRDIWQSLRWANSRATSSELARQPFEKIDSPPINVAICASNIIIVRMTSHTYYYLYTIMALMSLCEKRLLVTSI